MHHFILIFIRSVCRVFQIFYKEKMSITITLIKTFKYANIVNFCNKLLNDLAFQADGRLQNQLYLIFHSCVSLIIMLVISHSILNTVHLQILNLHFFLKSCPSPHSQTIPWLIPLGMKICYLVIYFLIYSSWKYF